MIKVVFSTLRTPNSTIFSFLSVLLFEKIPQITNVLSRDDQNDSKMSFIYNQYILMRLYTHVLLYKPFFAKWPQKLFPQFLINELILVKDICIFFKSRNSWAGEYLRLLPNISAKESSMTQVRMSLMTN